MANQAFFARIYLDADDTIHTEPTRSFGLLLDPDTQKQALSWASKQSHAGKGLTRTLMHYVEGAGWCQSRRPTSWRRGSAQCESHRTIAQQPIPKAITKNANRAKTPASTRRSRSVGVYGSNRSDSGSGWRNHSAACSWLQKHAESISFSLIVTSTSSQPCEDSPS